MFIETHQSILKLGTSFAFMRVMSEKQIQEWPKIHRRIVLMCGLIGMLLGLLMAIWNSDVFGWALLKVAGLGTCFAWASDVVVKRLMKAWLESKLQEIEKASAAAALKHAQPHGAKA
jgi:hypothetical protein